MIKLLIVTTTILFNAYIVSMDFTPTYKSVEGFPLLCLTSMTRCPQGSEKSFLKKYGENKALHNEILSAFIYIDSFTPEIRNLIISHLFDAHGMYAVPIFMQKPLVDVLNAYAGVKNEKSVSTGSFMQQFTYTKIELRNFFSRIKTVQDPVPLISGQPKAEYSLNITRCVSDYPLQIQTCPIRYKYKSQGNSKRIKEESVTISSIPGLLAETDITNGFSYVLDVVSAAININSAHNEQRTYPSAHVTKTIKNQFDDHDICVQKNIEDGNFFGLYAGHDGKQVPILLEKRFHILFCKAEGTIQEKIMAVCMQMNAIEVGKEGDLTSGSSIGVVFIKDKMIHCAHLGICRIFIKNKNGIACLTRDHTGKNNNEVERIANTHNYTGVNYQFYGAQEWYANYVYDEEGRDVGYVTRSIGDSGLCQLHITPEPEYCQCPLGEDHYIIITSNNAREDILSEQEEASALEEIFKDNADKKIEEIAKKYNDSHGCNRAIMIINTNADIVPRWKIAQWLTPATIAYTLGIFGAIAALCYYFKSLPFYNKLISN